MTHLGIVLAGGQGTRLYPATLAVSKQLLPIYDKPMIYYPLSTLMSSGLREILVITTPQQRSLFEHLLGTGEQWGIRLHYAEQPQPEGIAQGLRLAEPFLTGGGCTLILGDNIFHGPNLSRLLRAARDRRGATIFTYAVREPQRYGVVEFGPGGRPRALVEKPALPPSQQAVTGLYVYDEQAPTLAAGLTPSARGELEITDLNNLYLQAGQLTVEPLGRGFAWLDAGTHDSMLEAATFIQTLERRQALKIGSPEAVAFHQGWIDRAALSELTAQWPQSYTFYYSAPDSPEDSHETD